MEYPTLETVSWDTLAATSAKDGTLRYWEERVQEHLDTTTTDIRMWRLLAELYYYDKCYANCAWIAEHVRLTFGDTTIAAAFPLAYRRSLTSHAEEWEKHTCPEQALRAMAGEALSRDSWSERNRVFGELRKDWHNPSRWWLLAVLYADSEECWMCLWSLLTAVINCVGNDDDLANCLTDGFVNLDIFSRPPSLWGELVGSVAAPRISELLDMPKPDRIIALQHHYGDSFGLLLRNDAVHVQEIFE